MTKSSLSLKYRSFLGLLSLCLSMGTTACSWMKGNPKGQEDSPAEALRAPEALTQERGIFWGSMNREPVDFHELKAWGFTDFYLTHKYLPFSEIETVALAANKAGLRFHLWFEQGIQQGLPFVGTADAPEELWLRTKAFQEPGWQKSPLCREKQHNKAFLDIQNPEARRFFIDALLAYGQLENIESVTLDDHTSFHIGADGSNLPCLSFQRKPVLTESLTSLVNEAASELKAKAPHLKFILAHNPAIWALRTGLADWKKWNFDQKNIQTYVPSNVNNEIKLGLPQGISSVTLLAASSEIESSIKKALQQNLGVILFKLPKSEKRTRVTELLKGSPSNPPLAFQIDPKSCPFKANFFGIEEAYANCASSDTNPKILGGLTNCQKITCKALSGGTACDNDNGISRKFFCKSLAPKHYGQTTAEWEAMLELYRQREWAAEPNSED